MGKTSLVKEEGLFPADWCDINVVVICFIFWIQRSEKHLTLYSGLYFIWGSYYLNLVEAFKNRSKTNSKNFRTIYKYQQFRDLCVKLSTWNCLLKQCPCLYLGWVYAVSFKEQSIKFSMNSGMSELSPSWLQGAT